MKKWIFTLLAGYVAGLAVAMKYRKDQGQSKLSVDPNKSKMDSFIDEVVDIHKTAYEDVKGLVHSTFEDVKDFEGLKAKVNLLVENFSQETQTLVARIQESGTEQKGKLLDQAQALYAKHMTMIDEARVKGSSFADVAFETIESWLDQAKSKLETAHSQVKQTIDKKEDSTETTTSTETK